MSKINSKDGYEDYILMEIEDGVIELNSFLRRNRKETNATKFKIQLGQRLKSIQLKTRELILQSDLDPKEKLQSLSSILPMIMESLNIFPDQFRSNEIFFDLSILSNFLLLNLTTTGRNYDRWRLQASANILSKLLVSTPKLVELPEIDMSDIEGIKRTRNALIMTSGVYLETIITLYDINLQNFSEWASNAIFHFKQYESFLNQLNLSKLYLNTNGQQYFMLTRFFLLPIWNGLVFILNLKKTFANDWPEEIELHEFVTPSSSVDKIATKIQTTFSNHLDRIYNEYNQGRLSKNDNPKISDHLKRLSIIQEYSKLYQIHEKHMLAAIEGSDDDLQIIMNQAMKLKNMIDAEKSDKPDLESDYADYYRDLYGLMLEYYAVSDQEHPIISSIIEQIRSTKTVYSDLYYKLFKAELFKTENSDQWRSSWVSDIEFLKSQIQYKPRELLDISIIDLLIHHYYKDIPITQVKVDELKRLSSDLGRPDLDNVIAQYCRHLIDPDINVPKLPEKNVFDHHSWMMPIRNRNRTYYPMSLFGHKIVK